MNAPHHPPRPQPLDSGVQDVLRIARHYCELIEMAGSHAPGWLRDVSALLPRLQAAMTSVYYYAPNAEHDHPLDLDVRFDLYSRLRGLLADRDPYFLEFDRVHEEGDAMTGSLADDLTDIYCELKHGLLSFDVHPVRALETWFRGYEGHWGQHLIDAERHLANLAATQRLELARVAD